ncbi:type II toxin-antitoxin system HicA family toxin [Dyadobacter jiangsuensis]|uniref:type II toxin-antitoxin system HicA family toxin n=1 Tax=Dyadobacter fermentans TaxID=94254 RepID=UPI001CBE1193|nr:type II toxin-antitoxin system HicA family toxin [Dyadobacter fermentans]MBZ1359314.1 type II toxin-antitoxin system HicA family toxin [Dyadobacter fermentans]
MSVKRKEFLKYLESHGCFLKRHGGKHDVYWRDHGRYRSTVPRHPSLERSLCNEICKQLGIDKY